VESASSGTKLVPHPLGGSRRSLCASTSRGNGSASCGNSWDEDGNLFNLVVSDGVLKEPFGRLRSSAYEIIRESPSAARPPWACFAKNAAVGKAAQSIAASLTAGVPRVFDI